MHMYAPTLQQHTLENEKSATMTMETDQTTVESSSSISDSQVKLESTPLPETNPDNDGKTATNNSTEIQPNGMASVINFDDFGENMSVMESIAGESTGERGADKVEDLARDETKAVGWLRIAVIVVLIFTAAGICGAAFYFTRVNEEQDFESAFIDQAARVIDAFQINAKTRVGAIEAFALSITSHAKFSNSSWPYVTLPDFERRGRATSELAEVMSMIMVPLVTDETREGWETYSVENQGWFEEALSVEKEDRSNRRMQDEFNPWAIPEEIYRVKGLKAARERGPGPYLPQWQIAPVVPVPGLVNFNLLSHTGYQDSLNALLESQVAIVGRSFDFSDPNDEQTAGRLDVFNYFLENWKADNNGYEQDPVADIHVPLYDDFAKKDRKLVGLLTCVVYWKTYFVDILPDSAEGIIVVLENTCDQQYTYKINGVNVVYVGPGDQHDSQYDYLAVQTEDGAYLQVDNSARDIFGSCLYSIHVYPSEEFESKYLTNNPVLYTVVLVLIFLFTSAVFLIYDCLVERRQRVVMDTAVASNAIVSSLFPKVVRDRLYNGEAEGSFRKKNQGKTDKLFSLGDSENLQNTKQAEQDKEDSKPIADLFQNCTVLFADIVGFTGWSSGREPTEVFFLLEKLYGALDKIAKKRKVFKVETIGDCYLAVTGLPEPQEDHAVIMSYFAHECMRQMRFLMTRELRDALGPETSNLSMRFGLHSGPVTAGVLRGEKSRFQLFGDTVNTAARMESTGMRGRIQISQQTADCLTVAGKEDWCEARDEMVEAKGKGKLQTYWLRMRKSSMRRESARSLELNDRADDSSEELHPPGKKESEASFGEKTENA